MRCPVLIASSAAFALLLSACTFTRPVAITSAPLPDAPAVGSSKCTTLFGVFTWGDCSTASAMQAGGVRVLTAVDQRTFLLPGILRIETTIATGSK